MQGQDQWFSTITEVSNAWGILTNLENDPPLYTLLPHTRALKPVKPGGYHLRGTGEVGTSPDFLTTRTRRSPGPKYRP